MMRLIFPIVLWTLTLLQAYLLGNLNGAILVSRYLMHDDVRRHGSGNAGLTNYFRTYGGIQSLLVIAVDFLKCVLACTIARWLLPTAPLHAAMGAGLACIVGHSYPVFSGFKGGKGILCGAALGLMVDVRVFAIIMTVFILLVALTRLVSLGSVLAAVTFVVCVCAFYWGDWMTCVLAVAAAAFVIWRHRGNIVRLLRGTEAKLTFHKK